MNNIDNTEDTQKQVLKLFKYISLFSIKKRGGRTTFYLLRFPIWKIRRMENENLIKYYFLNIPLFRLYKAHRPTKQEAQLAELAEQIRSQNQQLADHYSALVEKIEDRMKVHHAELLERIDNLPYRS